VDPIASCTESSCYEFVHLRGEGGGSLGKRKGSDRKGLIKGEEEKSKKKEGGGKMTRVHSAIEREGELRKRERVKGGGGERR